MIRTAIRVGVLMRGVAVLVLALGVLVLAVGCGLAWRLSQGPLEIDWAARRVEAAANGPDQPTRLSVGAAAIRWAGFEGGPERGLELTLRQVTLAGADGKPVATMDALALNVSLGRLLVGELVPRSITVGGLNLSLLRDAHGDVSLDLGGLSLPDDNPDESPAKDPAGPTLRSTLAALARPPRRPGTLPQRPDVQHLEALQRVRIADTTLHLHDPALGSAIVLHVIALDLERRAQGGVHGTASATIGLGSAQATVAVRADLGPNGGTQMQLAFAPFNATPMQQAEPALATATVLDAAVGGSATMQLDSALHPVGAMLRLDAGGGTMRLADGVIGFDSLSLGAEAAWEQAPGHGGWHPPEHLTVSRMKAVVHAPGGTWPTTITASGHLDRGGATYTGDAEATLDHLNFADIGALWPKALGGHIRPWLVPNVTAGTARDGAIKLSFQAPADFSDVELTKVDGSAKGENVTIWWLRPVPPIEGAQAMLTINNPQTMDIAVTTAHQGNLALTNGLIHFTGLSNKDQFAALGADITGSVPELLTLLRNPTLQLLSRSPIPIHNPGGTMAGHLGINMPMKDVVSFDDIKIQTSVKANNLHLGALVAGRDLDQGTIQIDASSDAFHAAGPARLAGISSTLAFDMDFRNGGQTQVVEKASAIARVGRAQLATAGLDPGSLMPAGTGQFTGQFVQRRDGTGEVTVTGDLRDAELAATVWTKPVGQPASLSARLVLKGDQMTGIDQIHATGPGLVLDGRVEMEGDRPQTVVFDRLVLGRTQAAGRLRLPATPGEPTRATLSGPMLDISALKNAPTPSASRPQKPDEPWIADFRFDKAQLSAGPPLSGLVVHAENDGHRITTLDLTTAAPEAVHASIRPEAAGRRLVVRSADAGALLRAADVVGTMQGGTLTLDALYDDHKPAAPLTGRAELQNFAIKDAPILGKLLQAVTIYGMVDVLRGPGLTFSDAVLPFAWEGGVLHLTEARAFSASLGLTARGTIDTGHGTLDLQGTVVPAYVFNSMLGRIPLLGRLFSAEQGGGLVAVGYGLHGPVANPSVAVNPLSALTPGFLRGLFHIFD